MSQFNFGGTGGAGGGFSFGTPKTAASTAPTGFSFASAPSGGGFSFGTPAQNPASTQPAGLFSFATPTTSSSAPSGFSFGTPTTPAPAGNVFTLGGNAPKLTLGGISTTQVPAAQSGGFGLGSSVPTSVPASQPAAPSGFTFGSAVASQPAATTGGFSFGGGGAVAAQTGTPSFSLGSVGSTAPQAAPAGLAFGVAPAAAGAATSTAAAPQPVSAFSLGTQSTGTTTVPSTGFTLNLKPLTTTSAVAATSSAVTATATAPPVMTYAQLESLINKWSLELEDQEKHFLQQATQVNAWDRTLIENGEKITSLHREVEKVKLDQKRLDQELDFILSQQKELEDLLTPLEESVKEQSGTIYLQHADEEREKTYKLAENIDAQLKRMAQDLKDIIEHLNTSGGPADTSDPLQQICKILNAHMDSLQWIDQNSGIQFWAALLVSSSLGGDDLLLEDLETEGERQLRSLLQHQLDTAVSVEQCVAKRRRFAPAALYKPFGEEAAGARTLPQFRALQEGSRETASLRELGLSDAEIRLWTNRKAAAEKGAGLGAAPEARQQRLEAIREKIAERQRILALPQRFAGSKELSRREMEIEKALFQGTDRHAFLRGLYHQDETKQKAAQEERPPLARLEAAEEVPEPSAPSNPGLTPAGPPITPPEVQSSIPAPLSGPVMVTEPVEFVPEEEIRKNRLSEEELRQIPRFSSYSPGVPSEVLYLKNLGPRVTVRDLMGLFARFQEEGGRPVQFRLLQGRMRGQAFLTFPSLPAAQAALGLTNGFLLQGKPLVIEFGRRKAQTRHPSWLGPVAGGSAQLRGSTSAEGEPDLEWAWLNSDGNKKLSETGAKAWASLGNRVPGVVSA
ncbi:hypothetical protein lerEdw1_009106 [Lerista edwardsae]|nr:hypothetical protein lerEdw1_009106 [Lerista edwardsae]